MTGPGRRNIPAPPSPGPLNPRLPARRQVSRDGTSRLPVPAGAAASGGGNADTGSSPRRGGGGRGPAGRVLPALSLLFREREVLFEAGVCPPVLLYQRPPHLLAASGSGRKSVLGFVFPRISRGTPLPERPGHRLASILGVLTCLF